MSEMSIFFMVHILRRTTSLVKYAGKIEVRETRNLNLADIVGKWEDRIFTYKQEEPTCYCCSPTKQDTCEEEDEDSVFCFLSSISC